MKIAIIGGGVIGLSIAWEVSRRGHQAVVIEKSRLGRGASWAGAGILPPSNAATAIHPLEHLEARSDQLHPQWADRLKKETGIETGFQTCGGLYLARTAGERASLLGRASEWKERAIPFHELSSNELSDQFPALAQSVLDEAMAWWAPSETQICNPHHVQALAVACEKMGVELLENCGESKIDYEQGTVKQVTINPDSSAPKTISADAYCLTAGPWSGQIASQMLGHVADQPGGATGEPLPMLPVRGQMLLYKLDTAPFAAIVNEGTRYLVPRADGHVLFGATIEEVGFDTSTTESGIANLKQHAETLLPELTEARLVKTWAGLRPGTFDGFPYIGPLSHSSNLFVAAGHFKAGLHLSPGTAEVIADLIEQKTPMIDLRPFAPSRTKVSS